MSPFHVAVAGPNHMGGCQNYGPFLGTLNTRCRIIIGIQKGTIILTTTHILPGYLDPCGLEEGLGFKSFEVYGLEVYGLSCRAQGHRLDSG